MAAMSKTKAVVIFIVAAVVAWIAAYVPEMWRRHQTLDALDAPAGRWICLINGDAVSSQYEGYITKKYIMLGTQRFYSEEFKKWGRGADYILAIIDNNQNLRWMRLDLDETDTLARQYGISRAGCRRMEAGNTATNVTVPISPPIHQRVYTGPNGASGSGYSNSGGSYTGSGSSGGSGSFDWKRAVGPALEPSGGHAGSTGGASTGASPAANDGGVRP